MDPLPNGMLAETRSRQIVFGFIHEAELQLKLSEIAALIINMILGFYYHGEYFASFLEDHFEVSPDRLTLTNIKEIDLGNHTSYFNQWIESTSKSIVKWTLKINKAEKTNLKFDSAFYFGLATKESDPSKDFATSKTLNYCIDDLGWKYKSYMGDGRAVSFAFNEGDLVIFTLDLASKQWLGKVGVDGTDIELFDVEVSDDIKYKLAMQMSKVGDSVTLVSFERSYL